MRDGSAEFKKPSIAASGMWFLCSAKEHQLSRDLPRSLDEHGRCVRVGLAIVSVALCKRVLELRIRIGQRRIRPQSIGISNAPGTRTISRCASSAPAFDISNHSRTTRPSMTSTVTLPPVMRWSSSTGLTVATSTTTGSDWTVGWTVWTPVETCAMVRRLVKIVSQKVSSEFRMN